MITLLYLTGMAVLATAGCAVADYWDSITRWWSR